MEKYICANCGAVIEDEEAMEYQQCIRDVCIGVAYRIS